MAALQSPIPYFDADKTTMTETTETNTTMTANTTTVVGTSSTGKKVLKKKGVKPKLSAKEKKERNVCLSFIYAEPAVPDLSLRCSSRKLYHVYHSNFAAVNL